MPDYYLEDPGLRRRYRARLQLVRTATAVLTLSEASRVDVAEHLGLDPRRVFVVGAGTSARFVPPASRRAGGRRRGGGRGARAAGAVRLLHRQLREAEEPRAAPRGVVAPAGAGAGPVAAGAVLPARAAGAQPPAAPGRRSSGIEDSVCLTGFVHDDVLLLLHQGTDLFVFPSLYEGYGLPVAEALACGAPVLAADASSLPEIVGPEALFDATRAGGRWPPPSSGASPTTAFRERLLAAAGRAPSSWDGRGPAPRSTSTTGSCRRSARPARDRRRFARRVAKTPVRPAAAGWRSPAAPARPRRRRGRPPGTAPCWRRWRPGPISRSHAFADRPAGGDFERSAFAEDRRDRPRAVAAEPARRAGPARRAAVHPLAALEAVEGLDGRFDAVVYSLADDDHHTGCLAALRRRRDGVVVARDVALAGLYGHAARSGGLADGLAGTIRAAYGEAVHPGVGAGDIAPGREARRLGILLTRDVLAHCRGLLVTRPPTPPWPTSTPARRPGQDPPRRCRPAGGGRRPLRL